MATRGINKVILVGNLGNEPEHRVLPSGGAVTNISIATSESWKDKNTGQMEERTEWHRVVFFNRLAEIAAEYLRKGSKVYVEGQWLTIEWVLRERFGWFEKSEESIRKDVDAAQLSYFSSIFSNQQMRRLFYVVIFPTSVMRLVA